jgi:hypothetical protein
LQNLAELEIEARELLGDHASEWLVRPSSLLDGMTPAEVAATAAGKRVVLHELKRMAIPLRAAMSKKRQPKLTS